MFHDDISKRYDSLIVDIVEEQYISTESGIISYKAKLKLKGNSSLRIREIWEKQNLLKYSYYWLNSDNQLIIGWDMHLIINMLNLFHITSIINDKAILKSLIQEIYLMFYLK